MMRGVRHSNVLNKNIIRSFNSSRNNAGFFSFLFGGGFDNKGKAAAFAAEDASRRESSYDEEHVKVILDNNKKWVEATKAKGIITDICYLIDPSIHWSVD